MAKEKLLEDFHEGRKIKSFRAFFDISEYTDNKLPEQQKQLWVRVFEGFFSRGDSSLNRDDLALGFIEVIDKMDLGIAREAIKVKKAVAAEPVENEESKDAEDEPPAKERFFLVPTREEGEEYIIMEDSRKIEVFELLRTEDVFLLQFDWVIFHFGSKVAMYIAKIEQFKSLLVETARPLTGDIEKREAKIMLRSKMSDQIEILQIGIDRIRWELFGIPEEKVREIQSGNRQQDLTARRKEHFTKNK